MDRIEAIREIGSAFFSRCLERCSGQCSCADDDREALYALGVTPEELDAANATP